MNEKEETSTDISEESIDEEESKEVVKVDEEENKEAVDIDKKESEEAVEAAKENAEALMNKKKYIFAAFFYLLADDIRSTLDIIYNKLKDINLTICLMKLLENNNFIKNINKEWKNIIV